MSTVCMTDRERRRRRRRSRFRPCIDLHDGKVKQIVSGTLSHGDPGARTRFVTSQPAGDFARLYERHDLRDGHVIKLGPGNDDAAREALGAWPGGMQVGGGITAANAQEWLDAGASKVIVGSYLFPEGRFERERLEEVSRAVGRDRLVVDMSCRRRGGGKWVVAMSKSQDVAGMEVNRELLDMLSEHCSEFLIHGSDVEGLCQGIDKDLVEQLGEWVTIPTTYAGGARDVADLALVDALTGGKVDLAYGSALDIFGGSLVKLEDLVACMSHEKRG